MYNKTNKVGKGRKIKTGGHIDAIVCEIDNKEIYKGTTSPAIFWELISPSVLEIKYDEILDVLGKKKTEALHFKSINGHIKESNR